jgi:hypothetical protein
MHPFIKILDESQRIEAKDNALMYEDDDLKEILRERRRQVSSSSSRGDN